MALGCYQLIIGQTSGFLSTHAVVLTERALFIHEVPTVLGGPVGWAGEFGRNHQDRVLSRRVANIDSTWSIKLMWLLAQTHPVQYGIFHTSRPIILLYQLRELWLTDFISCI